MSQLLQASQELNLLALYDAAGVLQALVSAGMQHKGSFELIVAVSDENVTCFFVNSENQLERCITGINFPPSFINVTPIHVFYVENKDYIGALFEILCVFPITM